MQTKRQAIEEINKLFFKLLWNDKGDKMKRTFMINDYPEGGSKWLILHLLKNLARVAGTKKT